MYLPFKFQVRASVSKSYLLPLALSALEQLPDFLITTIRLNLPNRSSDIVPWGQFPEVFTAVGIEPLRRDLDPGENISLVSPAGSPLIIFTSGL